MSRLPMVLFFTVFTLGYTGLNVYAYTRARRALASHPRWRRALAATFLVVALAFPAGHALERTWFGPTAALVVWVGAFWIAALVYFVLAALVADIVRWVLRRDRFLEWRGHAVVARVRPWILLGVVVMVGLTLALGHRHARAFRVTETAVDIAKPVPGRTSLRMVAVSDVHMGTIIGAERVATLVAAIQALAPDLIVFVGDTIDADLGPVIAQNLGASLLQLSAPYGVFAVLGNHEYIGGVEPARHYLESHGLRVLVDEVLEVVPGVTLVGRDDRHRRLRAGGERAPLDTLLATVDKRTPIIVLDHQPHDLHTPVENGVDLHISGHTHDGQLWPISLITDRIYTVPQGHRRMGTTHVVVSSGFGTWGPPVRTGTTAEIHLLTLRFGAP